MYECVIKDIMTSERIEARSYNLPQSKAQRERERERESTSMCSVSVITYIMKEINHNHRGNLLSEDKIEAAKKL